MTKIVIRPLDSILTNFGNQLGSLSEGQARVALARAVNRTATMVRTRVIREIVKQSSIPRAQVVKTVRLRKAAHKGGALEAVVYAYGRPLSLKLFKPRQFSWGVRAKVWGEFQRYEHAFIHGGRWNSGKLAFGGHVMERAGASRFPIRRLNGPSVPAEMVRGASAEAFNEIVQTKLPERVRHELSRILT